MEHLRTLGTCVLALTVVASSVAVSSADSFATTAGELEPTTEPCLFSPKVRLWTRSQLSVEDLRRVSEDSKDPLFGSAPDQGFERDAPAPFVGRLVERNSDTIVVLDEKTRKRHSFDLNEVHRLDVAEKGNATGAGIVGGLVVGAGMAYLISDLTYEECEGELGCFFKWDRGSSNTLSAVMGGLVGGILGAVVGSAIRTDDWEQVPLRHNFTMTPALRADDRGASFAVEARFR